MRPIVIDKAKVIELREKCSLSQAEISRLLGCTQGYVNKVLRDSGIKRRGKTGGSNPRAAGVAREVIEYIQKNGGSVQAAIKKVGKVSLDLVYRIAKELDVGLGSYRYLGLTNKHWVVHKPGFTVETSHNYYRLPVECVHCGHEHSLYRHELVHKRQPEACPNCGATEALPHVEVPSAVVIT